MSWYCSYRCEYGDLRNRSRCCPFIDNQSSYRRNILLICIFTPGALTGARGTNGAQAPARSLTYCLPRFFEITFCDVKDNGYICQVSGSPSTIKWNCQFNVVMEKMRLRVQTVPAMDPVTHLEHTAYTVILQDGEVLKCASGWTLQDAIETFCKWFNVERRRVCLLRPFFPQKSCYYE